jgi:para-nitrobenzyl esterase
LRCATIVERAECVDYGRGPVIGYQASGRMRPSKDHGRYLEARSRRGEDTSPFDILVALNSDLMFRIPALQMAEAKAEHNPSVFNYLFTYRSPVFGGALGACHALEMMQDAWASFARTGNPSCESLGEWPAYGDRRTTMILGTQSRLEDAPYEPERRAWDVLGELSNILM